MLKLAIAYGSTALAFLLLDGGWLATMGPRLYKPEIGELLTSQVRLGPAAAFYVLYIGGLIYFCVAPNLAGDWRRALLAGAVLGVVAYGTYDLTCAATMRIWSAKVTLADMVWGGFASAAASVAGVFATRAAARMIGGLP